MKNEKPIRNSNHELLRILSMYMIVFVHSGIYLDYFCSGMAGKIFGGVLNGICNIGVTCFILISGYYGARFSIKKFVRMECMMITFSLLETAVLWLAMPENMQGAALLEQLIKSLLPFITRKYWFYSSYVCLLLLNSYIQKFIDMLKREEMKIFLFLLLFLFSVLPTCFYFELIPDNGKGLVQMIMIYMIGRYIRRYQDIRLPKWAGLVFFGLWIVNGVSYEMPLQLGGVSHHLCKDNSMTNIVMAIILFYLFKEMKLEAKIVNKAAEHVFAVFALNYSLVSVIIERMMKMGWKSPDGVLGFLAMALAVFLIMALCLMAGVIRKWIFGRLDRKLGEVASAVASPIELFLKKISK